MKKAEEINEDRVMPKGTTLIQEGQRYEIEEFTATYSLKELDRGETNRRIIVQACRIDEFDIVSPDEEHKTYMKLQRENAKLKAEIEQLKDQIFSGHGGKS